jgi:hypothetical protein
MDGSNYRNTLTFVVSGAMVMGSLQAAAQRGAPQFAHGDVCASKLQSYTPAGAAAVDDASPLSTSSRFVALQTASSITPTSVESLPPDSQQQQLCHLLSVQRQQQDVNRQVQLPLQQQPAALQIGTLQPGALQGAAGAVPQGPAKWAWQQQQQQQQQLLLQQQQQQQVLHRLVSQSSGGSFSSTSSLRTSLPGGSGDSFTSNVSTATANSMAWQQLLKHQQLQLVQQQPIQQVQQVQQVQLIPAMRTLPNNAGSVLGKRLSAPSGYEQHPTAKKAATSSAVAAMLQASLKNSWPGAAAQQQNYQQQQQQLVLLPVNSRQQTGSWQVRAQLPPTGLIRQRQQQQQQMLLRGVGASSSNLALVPAGAAAAAAAAAAVAAPGPMCVLEPAQQKLLHWAGRVLNCQLQDAYLLGSHLYKRVTGQLDDMLLISLGVTASSESVTMLISLWVASKLEGHRRQVAGASKLAAALQLMTGSITDIELHVMQRLQWQPYAGWSGRA